MKRMALSLLLMILVLPAAVSAVGNISVSSSPAGATIYLDGQSGSVTPATVESVSPGSHTILLKLTGYQDNSQTVQVSDNQTSTVSATLTPVTPTQLIKYAGDSQSATVGTAVSTLPSVIVKDASNNPVSGVSVTFSVTSGNGAVTGPSATTGSNGIATAGGWTLGPNAGTNVLTATSGTLPPVTFLATGNPATVAPTISSITPTYGYNSSTVSITALAGSGFVSGATIVLTKSGQTNISASSVVFSSSTLMTCTFDITGKTVGYWNVILTNPDGQPATLANGFEIRAPTNGGISFGSSPSGANVYINASNKGTTPFSLYDLTPGSYFIRMQRSGYADYTSQVTVTPGNTTQFFAYLKPVETYTTTSTPVYTTLTTTPTTVRTTKKTTTKGPTPWPSDTPTQASPIGPLVILGAIGFGVILLRKD